jgi:Family of unknown function (DUF5670)
MFETIAIILVVLWFFGFVSSHTMGGFIHVLLVLAVVVIVIRVLQGRRALGQSNGWGKATGSGWRVRYSARKSTGPGETTAIAPSRCAGIPRRHGRPRRRAAGGFDCVLEPRWRGSPPAAAAEFRLLR